MPRSERIGDDGAGLAARVRTARRTLDLPAAALAGEVGVTERALRLIEDGTTRAPSVFLMLRIARVLGLSIDFLAFGAGSAEPTRQQYRRRTKDDLDDAAFGARVKRLREEHGFSIADLSRYSGLSDDTIRRLEDGSTTYAAFAIGVRLADALGVDARWLALGTHALTAQRFEDLEQRLTAVERTIPRRALS